MAEATYTLVVGFYNYADLRQLQDGLQGSNLQIVSAQQDAQRVYDDAVELDADAVLICPDIAGYRHAIIQDLLLHPERPIPVIGWVVSHDDRGRVMTANGARGIIALPMTSQGITKLLPIVPQAIQTLKQERADGLISLNAGRILPAGRQGAWQQKVITIFVPKGGGSTRTTLAVNLAAALSHVALGNQPTCLLDMDMSKGDCHTFLGYTLDRDAARRNGRVFLDRGFFDLIINVTDRWDQGADNLVDPVLLRKFLIHWGDDQSQLDLLPGLTRPHQGAAPEFANWDRVLRIARRVIQVAKQMYSFVIVDIGQDFNLPLHRAAIEEADEVLVTVPPVVTAIVDTENALVPLLHKFGDLNKFKLVITAFDPAFGVSEKEIARRLGLPKLVTIPFDALTASVSINTHTPFVLADAGPLGETVRTLAAAYLPYLKTEGRSAAGGLLGVFRRALVREA
jgi:Flp pilus assembly CpaE family ATPase